MTSAMPCHDRAMRVGEAWSRQPVATGLAIGSVIFGVVGCVVGLVVGVLTYPATAWFATFEVGVPAAFLGAMSGVTAGLLALAYRSRTRVAP
jgi:hypothetical protein